MFSSVRSTKVQVANRSVKLIIIIRSKGTKKDLIQQQLVIMYYDRFMNSYNQLVNFDRNTKVGNIKQTKPKD